MLKFTCAFLVLLMLGLLTLSSTRSDIISLTDKTVTQWVSKQNMSLNDYDLVHMHHVDLHDKLPNLNYSERIRALVQIDKERRNPLGGIMIGKKATFMMEHHLNLRSLIYHTSGIFALEVIVDKPYGKVNLYMDTGTDLIWMRCKPWVKASNGVYVPNTFKPLRCDDPKCLALGNLRACEGKSDTCQFDITYFDGNRAQGDFGSTEFRFTQFHSIHNHIHTLYFGCAHDLGGVVPFIDPAGIIGMAQGPLSLISQLGAHVFSYCFINFIDDDITKKTLFYIGHAGPIDLTFTEMIHMKDAVPRLSSNYFIKLKEIIINDKEVHYHIPDIFKAAKNGDRGFLLDSAQTFSNFVRDVYLPFEEAINSSVVSYLGLPLKDSMKSYGFGLCYNVVGKGIPKYPTVAFQFEDQQMLTLPPHNVFMEVIPGSITCLAFNSLDDETVNIFGAYQQINLQLTYVLGPVKLFGFAPRICAQ